jgi:hypothetical protein
MFGAGNECVYYACVYYAFSHQSVFSRHYEAKPSPEADKAYFCEVMLLDTPVCAHSGSSKAIAKRQAALVALDWIEENPKKLYEMLEKRAKNPQIVWQNIAPAAFPPEDHDQTITYQDTSNPLDTSTANHSSGDFALESSEKCEDVVKETEKVAEPFIPMIQQIMIESETPLDSFLHAVDTLLQQYQQHQHFIPNISGIPFPVLDTPKEMELDVTDPAAMLQQLIEVQEKERKRLEEIHAEQLRRLTEMK